MIHHDDKQDEGCSKATCAPAEKVLVVNLASSKHLTALITRRKRQGGYPWTLFYSLQSVGDSPNRSFASGGIDPPYQSNMDDLFCFQKE